MKLAFCFGLRLVPSQVTFTCLLFAAERDVDPWRQGQDASGEHLQRRQPLLCQRQELGGRTARQGKTCAGWTVFHLFLQARFFIPLAITVDANGVLYVADTQNHRIRMIQDGERRHRSDAQAVV